MKKSLYILTFACTFAGTISGQETDMEYQVIIESRGEYKNQEFTSNTLLYPIFRFRHKEEKVSSLLQVEGSFLNSNFCGDSLSFLFQELYTQFIINEKQSFSFGKRRLNWGSGMVWNPTNFYIQKDPFRTQNRLDGIFQASYSLLFSKGILQAYIFPEKRLKDFSYALKYDFYVNRVDASISLTRHTRFLELGYSISYGGDVSTLYAEGVFRKKFRTEAVAGFSRQLNARLSLRGEYRFREEPPLIYDPISIGKHTLFANMEWKDIYDRYSIQIRGFYDPDSNRLIVSPLFIWKYNNLQIEVSAMIYNDTLPLFNQGTVLLSYHF